MTWESLALALLIAATGGILLPTAALMRHRELNRRIAREPAATELENLDAKLVEARRDFEAVVSEVKSKRGEVADLEVRASVAIAEADDATKRKITIEEDLLTLEPRRQELEQCQTELANCQESMADLSQRKTELESAIQHLKLELENLTEQAERAHKITAKLPQLEAAWSTKRSELLQAEQEHGNLKKEITELRDARGKLNAEITSLEAMKAALERTHAELHGYIEQDKKEDEERKKRALADLQRAPACLSEANLQAARAKEQEMQALDRLQDYLRQCNLEYSKRTLYAFHTCLKINDLSPLTVLAGISGTGKSELPRRYAEGMGIHFLQMAVQPRWDSPQDLFGFYNYLEHRYIATDLARALTHLDQHNHPEQAKPWQDRMLLVLLDEMNLARVEYYFSEFLSRLEVRKSVDASKPASRLDAEIAFDIGGRDKPFNVFVDRNVLFVGTMNEDESTQTLSDKVIDRANVLRFGRPKDLADDAPRQDVPRAEEYLSRQAWASWSKAVDSQDMSDAQALSELGTWIKRLNEIMDQLERPFAHRINQAIRMYCINYPDLGAKRLRVAFGDQLEQRILPKLRGIDTADCGDGLGQLLSFVQQDIGDVQLGNAIQQGRDRPLFTWQGINR